MHAAEPAPSAAESLLLLAVQRLTLGTLFVYVFFENLGKALYTPGGYASLIRHYVEPGTAPAAWKAVMRFMAERAAVAAPLQAVIELAPRILLLLGLAPPLVALAAFAWLTSLWVSEWGTPWVWELLVPMVMAVLPGPRAAGRPP